MRLGFGWEVKGLLSCYILEKHPRMTKILQNQDKGPAPKKTLKRFIKWYFPVDVENQNPLSVQMYLWYITYVVINTLYMVFKINNKDYIQTVYAFFVNRIWTKSQRLHP